MDATQAMIEKRYETKKDVMSWNEVCDELIGEMTFQGLHKTAEAIENHKC